MTDFGEFLQNLARYVSNFEDGSNMILGCSVCTADDVEKDNGIEYVYNGESFVYREGKNRREGDTNVS